jgi:hypothetical protein
MSGARGECRLNYVGGWREGEDKFGVWGRYEVTSARILETPSPKEGERRRFEILVGQDGAGFIVSATAEV